MKTWTTLMVVFLVASSGARAQNNRIGIFTTTMPTPTCEQASFYGALPGQFEVYAVLTHLADNAGLPLAGICGYEFAVSLPTGFAIYQATLPPGVVNGGEIPVFDCLGTVPVTDGRVLLATLNIATFTGTEGFVYLEPVPDPEIPGSLSICAPGEPATAVAAVPSSGGLQHPVFRINMDIFGNCFPLPEEPLSWSTIKALYR